MRELSVLIVDDDAAARRGLSACVDWEKLNMRVVGECINGREALSVIESGGVDIVLSDVRMPFMDGLELSHIVSENHPQIVMLLISGYGEIDYLKSALDAQVLNYILKPVDVDELERSLKKAAEEIRLSEEKSIERERMIETLNRSLPLLRERFLRELLESGAGDEENAFCRQAGFLGIDMPWDAPYFLLLVRTVSEHRDSVGAQYAALRAGERIWESIARSEQPAFVASLGQWEYAVLYRLDGAEREDLSVIASALLAELTADGEIDVDIGVGPDVDGVSNLRLSYHIARQALFQSYFEGHNRLLYANHTLYETENHFERWDGGEQMETLLLTGDIDALNRYLDMLFVPLAQRLTIAKAQRICRQMMTVAIRILIERTPGRSDLIERAASVIAQISGIDTFDSLTASIRRFMLEALEALRPEDAGYRAAIAHQVAALIEEQYAMGVTIKDLAEAVHYSPAYVSYIFRAVQNETINDYLTRIRMRKATELMRDPKYRMYEIARMVGYADNKYFTKLFKKTYGVLPSEYREGKAKGEER